jgi:signal transduction histidine kinase
MLPNERTTRSEVATLPDQLEALVVAPGRQEARALVAFLKAQKLNVALAHDADSAFEEALLHRPNLVAIHDAIEPAGGIELCQRLKNNTRTHFLPAILFTNVDNRQHRIRALATGVDAIFGPGMDELERQTRLWALLRSQALHRRLERRLDARGSTLKERGRWLGGFTHDVQNAVGALQANFEFLAQVAGRAGEGAVDVAECARETRQVFHQLARGFRTVQEYERFDSGRVVLRSVSMGANALARDAKDDLAWQVSGLRKPVVLDVAGEEVFITGDPEYLREALGALAGYLLRGSRNTRVVVRTQREGQGCRIVIAGDSEPIAPEDEDTIFDPYAQPARRAPLAQGLALALARLIVEMHGGTVRVQNEAETGAGFVIELPSTAVQPSRPQAGE